MRSLNTFFLLFLSSGIFLLHPIETAAQDDPTLEELIALVSTLQDQVNELQSRIEYLEQNQIFTTSVSGFNVREIERDDAIDTRILDFVKRRADSRLRITYNDNFGFDLSDESAFGLWNVMLDGNNTQLQTATAFRGPTGPSMGASLDYRIRRQSTLVGYIDGVSAGSHRLQIAVERVPNGGDATTSLGFDSTFLLQVEEVPAEQPLLLGDINLDGIVDLLDVTLFVELIASGQFQAEADFNFDGQINLLDVGPFVDLIAGN